MRAIAASAAIALSLGLGAGTASAVAEPTDHPCSKGDHKAELPTTWTGMDQATLVKGGAAVESTITVQNNSGYDLPGANTMVGIGHSPSTAGEGYGLTIETKTDGGDWKPVPSHGGNEEIAFNFGTHDLAKDATWTIHLRVSAGANANAGNHVFGFFWNTNSTLDDDTGKLFSDYDYLKGPGVPGGKHTCTDFRSNAAAHFTTVEATNSATPTATASTTATPTTSAKPATRTATAAGPQLASTGGGDNALPLAATGAAAVALGAGVLVALRRRRGSHS